MHNRRQVNNKPWLLYAGVLGLIISMLGPLLISPIPTYAINRNIDPDGDGSVGFGVTPSGSHFEAINDAVREPNVPNTGDNISSAVNSGAVDNIRMSSFTGVQSVSEITVWVYHNDGSNGEFSLQLYDDNESTTRSSVTAVPTSTSNAWDSVTFSGLSLTQAQLDTLTVRITIDRASGGQPATATIYAMYADVTYSAGPVISLSSDGAVDFGAVAPGAARNTTPGDLNDGQTISIDGDPVDLDVRSTNFSDGGSNTWSLGTSAGADQVQWEFSPNGSSWTTFAAAETLYSLDTNVPNGATRNLHLRLTAPTSTSSWAEHSTTVTIVATVP